MIMKRVRTSKFMLFTISIAIVVSSVTGCLRSSTPKPIEDYPKNVIFMIGDGMGPMQVQMAADYKGSPLNMEEMLYCGQCSTLNVSGQITDSAAAGTALATGTKTSNGRVGMNANGLVVLPNIREYFAGRGKSTGIVTTTSIADGTPAAFGAHVLDRTYANEITESYIKTYEIDVVMGGGSTAALMTLAMGKGYAIARTRTELLDTRATKILGLFAIAHMPFEHERNSVLTPSLEEMTVKAISVLDRNPNGFFLMVEGGRIDHAGHLQTAGSDAVTMGYKIATCVGETLEFDKAVQAAIDFAERDGNTLVIVTADHETGDLRQRSGDAHIDHEPDRITCDHEDLIEWLEEKYIFNSSGHSSTNVPVFAYGVGAERFTGVLDNTDFYHMIIDLVESPLENGAYIGRAVGQ
jgi:alkaline phosphatase